MNSFINRNALEEKAGPRRRRLVVYVAGPYRDARGMYYVDKNIEEARQVAAELWSWDFAVLCPHTNTRFMDGYEGIKTDAFLEGDLDQVERVDLVVMMPRWRSSAGSKGEFEHATRCGIPVFLWEDGSERKELKALGRTYLRDPEAVQLLNNDYYVDGDPARDPLNEPAVPAA